MKTLLLSTTLAAGLGAMALSPASAQVTVSPGYDNGRDCRMVERTVIRDGVKRVTRERVCDRDRYDRYSDRRYDDRPGINLNLGR